MFVPWESRALSGRKIALLIEDKVDAIAMPNQCARYMRRGEKGVREGIYDDFHIFILCPEKYREKDEEAKRYDYFVA